MEKGWVKLHRQMFSNRLWLSESFTKAQAWVDLFANANHEDGSFWIRGNEIKIKRGEIGWSELTMAQRWRWSRMKVRRFLHGLEMEGQVRQQKLYKLTTILTILNYDRFQSETSNETTERQQKDNRRDTNKNDKNVKNDKKNTILAEASSAEEFSIKEEIVRMEANQRRDINIIAFYFREVMPDIKSREQLNVAIRRHLRAAKELVAFTDPQLVAAVKKARDMKVDWTLETLIKILTK